ncbi:DUF488 domain-containing protein [Dyella marensis]|jgi:uncharacterized protein YeaO (DUF488 family)|uniref:Uncharacterized conserved protein YeaO, DUF488 family n=1 Tax=Dyella marensis TaxID=500610 RepID=A0A1I2IQB8_9GAMM|nr:MULTISPECIES: DUF488 domain-containing protein [Dyella]SFF44469.1 Uncharacterized conserved protein YeaO, DUF488 family [Dyella marensis]
MSIAIKRVYEPIAKSDGKRVLVDRLWPRGVNKDEIALDMWAKELAPSVSLRRWFGHDPSRWDTFRHRYATELDGKTRTEHWRELVREAAHHRVTLLYGAKDEEHNNAVALKAYLEAWIKGHGPH